MNNPRDTIRKLTLPCQCGADILLITEFDKWGDEDYQCYWEFFEQFPGIKGFRNRIKTAIAVVRNKESFIGGVILNEKEVKEMRDFLNTTIGD